MAQNLTIYKKCEQCSGTGTFQSSHGQDGSPIPCNWPGCDAGYIEYLKYNLNPGIDDAIDKCNDIIDKCNDILEKCNNILLAIGG